MWYGCCNHSAIRCSSFIIYWHCECYIGALTTQPSRTDPLSLLPLWMWYGCSNHSTMRYCSFIRLTLWMLYRCSNHLYSHRILLLYHLLPLWIWFGCSNHSTMRYCALIIFWHCACDMGALTTQPSWAVLYHYCHCECDMGALTTQPWGTAPLSFIATMNVIWVL